MAEETAKQLGIEIDKKKVLMSEPLKTKGNHTVEVKLHPQVIAELKVVINEL
ncbi:MAG: hypothetical protein LBM02_06730 [Lachnospiraceae bacterium]|nr:hypothetical protein [Lachnospiraceae bacterium]